MLCKCGYCNTQTEYRRSGNFHCINIFMVCANHENKKHGIYFTTNNNLDVPKKIRGLSQPRKFFTRKFKTRKFFGSTVVQVLGINHKKIIML